MDVEWRALCRRLALFLLPVLGGWAMLESWTARIPSSYSLKRERLHALSTEIETLILGASDAYHGVAPQELSGSAYNLANVSQSLYYDDQLFTQVVPQLPRLKRVIIPIQYISLFFELYDFFEDWRTYFYWQEWQIPPQRFGDLLDLRMWSRAQLRPAAYYKSVLGAEFQSVLRAGNQGPSDPDLAVMDRRGWWQTPVFDNRPQKLDAYAAAPILARHNQLMQMAYEQPNLGYLKHILSVAREHNIECVFVTLPVWKTYRDGMQQDRWRRTQADIQSLATTYHVRYFCFLDLEEFGPDDFTDVDHMSPAGAIRFTRVLSHALNQTRAAAQNHE
jgi:hypothetical protein